MLEMWGYRLGWLGYKLGWLGCMLEMSGYKQAR